MINLCSMKNELKSVNFNMFMLLLYLNWDDVERAFIITQKRSLVWTRVENESVKQHQWKAVRFKTPHLSRIYEDQWFIMILLSKYKNMFSSLLLWAAASPPSQLESIHFFFSEECDAWIDNYSHYGTGRTPMSCKRSVITLQHVKISACSTDSSAASVGVKRSW